MNFSFTNLDKITQGDNAAKKSFVDLFVSEMSTKELPMLLAALENNDAVSLHSRAHAIKSNVRFFGIFSVVDRLQYIEDITESGVIPPNISSEIKSVKKEIEKTCAEMHEWSENIVLNS